MFRLRYLVLIGVLLLSVAAMATDLSQKMVMVNQRPMISLRDFAETLDATVDYQVDRNEISITVDDTTVYLHPDSMTAWVNDRKVWLDMPVVIIDDVTYLPLRFMCDAFGLRYDWTPDNQQFTVINRWTMERIVLIIDLEWGRRAHNWRHDYDYHTYVNFHTRHDTNGYQHGSHGAPQGGPGQYHGGAPQDGPGQHDTHGDAHGGVGKPGGDAQHGAYPPPAGGMNQHGGYGKPDGDAQHGAYPPPDGRQNQHGVFGKPDGNARQDETGTPPADGRNRDGKDRQYNDPPRHGGNPDVREVRPGDDKPQQAGGPDHSRKDRENQDGGEQPNDRDHQAKRTGRH